MAMTSATVTQPTATAHPYGNGQPLPARRLGASGARHRPPAADLDPGNPRHGRGPDPLPQRPQLRAAIPLSNTNYHVTELAKAGLIELAGERQVRGATEHFYRMVRTALQAAAAPADERRQPLLEADDGSRTRDLELGKLALYQLSYVRARLILDRRAVAGGGGI